VNNGFVTFISASTKKVLKQIVFDGLGTTPISDGAGNASSVGIEQCKYNPRTNTIWIAVPADNNNGGNASVVQISNLGSNPLSPVFTTYHLGGLCGDGSGLAIGPTPQMLLGGCGAIVDDGSNGGTPGAVLFSPSQFAPATVAGADEVAYSYSFNHYYQGISSDPNCGNKSTIGVIDAASLPSTENACTKTIDPHGVGATGSHSIEVDPVTNYVFVPINGPASFGAGLCSSQTDFNGNPGVDAKGCILVLTPGTPDSDDPAAPVKCGSPAAITPGEFFTGPCSVPVGEP